MCMETQEMRHGNVGALMNTNPIIIMATLEQTNTLGYQDFYFYFFLFHAKQILHFSDILAFLYIVNVVTIMSRIA